jgi:hypothetical protein
MRPRATVIGIVSSLLLTGMMAGESQAEEYGGQWVELAGDLAPEAGGLVRPSLAIDRSGNPVVGFDDNVAAMTSVARWRHEAWTSVAPAIAGTSGPSVGTDEDGALYLCQAGKYSTPAAALTVLRFGGQQWRSIGGDVAAEAGYAPPGPRHVVDACGGIAIDSAGDPIVTWEALVGSKSWAVFAARWDSDQQLWAGLGDSAVTGGRAVTTYIDVDANDKPYLATTSMTSSRLTTVQAWRWNGRAWRQLGSDMTGSEDAVIGVYENARYLAMRQANSGEFLVLRWRQGNWQSLPSPGTGVGRPALDFTPSGEPVVAYRESADQGLTSQIIVKAWNHGAWQPVGDVVADISCELATGESCYPQASLDLVVDPVGRAVVAWGEASPTLGPDGNLTWPGRLTVKRSLAETE